MTKRLHDCKDRHRSRRVARWPYISGVIPSKPVSAEIHSLLSNLDGNLRLIEQTLLSEGEAGYKSTENCKGCDLLYFLLYVTVL